MPLKNQRINLLNQEFSRSLRGYSPRAVDDFIQDAVDTIAHMSDERLRLMKQVERLEKQLIAFAGKENSLQKLVNNDDFKYKIWFCYNESAGKSYEWEEIINRVDTKNNIIYLYKPN